MFRYMYLCGNNPHSYILPSQSPVTTTERCAQRTLVARMQSYGRVYLSSSHYDDSMKKKQLSITSFQDQHYTKK